MPARQMAKRCIIAMLLLFSCLLLFAGCTPAGEEGTSTPQDGSVEDAAAAGDSAEEAVLTVTDSLGEELVFSAAPQSVVCLQASLAEIWLLAGGTMVGVTDDAGERGLDIGDAAPVGTTHSPSTEAIFALAPDLVVYSPDISGQTEAAGVLEQAGIVCYAAKVDTFDDYIDVLSDFCTLTGDDTAFLEYGEAVEAEIAAVIDAVPEGIELPSVLFMRGYSSGVKAKAREHVVCDILDDLGADNIAARHDSLLEDVSLETVIAEDPAFIFVVYMGEDNAAAEAALAESLTNNPAWADLRAVREGNFITLPRELFHYKPNQRWGEAYAYIFDILYPQSE